MLCMLCTLDEIIHLINGLDTSKSTGLDEISVRILVADKGHRFRHPLVHLPRATHARGKDQIRVRSQCPRAAVFFL